MTPVSPSTLTAVAKQAAGEYFSEGTDPSSAVVKAAALLDVSLTDEHVRRICEMTNHEIFERTFREKAGSMDRYVTYTPPDPVFCAEQLHAEKIHKPPPSPMGVKVSGMETLKAASAPRQKYVPVNRAMQAFLPTAEKVAENWHQPFGEILRLRDNVKEAARTLETQVVDETNRYRFTFEQLAAQAEQACKEGASVPMVLHVCTAGMDGNVPSSEVSETLVDVASHLAQKGYNSESKVASTMVPNPAHPLAQLFYKAASHRANRTHFEFALEDLRHDLKDVEAHVRQLCT